MGIAETGTAGAARIGMARTEKVRIGSQWQERRRWAVNGRESTRADGQEWIGPDGICADRNGSHGSDRIGRESQG